MSTIMKLALCPAPFQKPKKRNDKKKDKKTTCPEAPIQHIITDTFVPSFVEGSNSKLQQYRPSSASPRSSPSSSPHQPTQQPHNHQDIGPIVRNVGIHNIHHSDCHCCSSQQSGYSRVTQSSCYQSDYKSGYITDGDGAFESHLLQKATKDRPANLRMTAVRDYSPCCNEELAVRKGQRVKVLYRNHDWVFAVTKHGQAGFIPFTYVRPSRKYNGYQSEPEITRVDDTYMSGYDTDIQTTTSGRFPFPPPKPRDIPPSYSINTGCHRTGSGSPIQTRSDAFDSGYMSAIEGPTYRTSISRHGSSTSQIRGFRPGTSKPLIDSFDKQYLEQLVVIHDFEAREEDEVFVSKGERVKVLNADDPQWLWVVTVHTGEQGFIPRSCCTLGNHPALSSPAYQRSSSQLRQPHMERSHTNGYTPHGYPRHFHHRNMRMQAKDRFRQLAMIRSTNNPITMDKEEIKRIGTKLIVLFDYEAGMEDELTVEFSETLIADILTQTGSERIWAYCPRTDQCGYVPMSMVVPPVV